MKLTKNIPFKPALMAGLTLAIAAPFASAATVTASLDTRGDSTAATGATLSSSTSDLWVGAIDGTRSLRSYLTFDLSGETAATGLVSLTLSNNGTENNDATVVHQWTLFSLSSTWVGESYGVDKPTGPTGTALDTISVTVGINHSTDVTFSGAAFTAAYNAAVGGDLYLGISSDQEGVDARSFAFLGSSEDVGKEPTITYTPVPEPSSTALLGLGGLALILRRKK